MNTQSKGLCIVLLAAALGTADVAAVRRIAFAADSTEKGEAFSALAQAEAEVARLRKLAAEEWGKLPELADSLSKLGKLLSKGDRQEEAVEAAKEAVKVYRDIAERMPGFRSYLAGSLNSLAAHLSRADRLEEALAAKQEAVKIYRELAEESRENFILDDLADSLNSLGLLLTQSFRFEEALEAVKESVSYRRELAERDGERYRHDLKFSLKIWAQCLRAVGREDEAAAAEKEAELLGKE